MFLVARPAGAVDAEPSGRRLSSSHRVPRNSRIGLTVRPSSRCSATRRHMCQPPPPWAPIPSSSVWRSVIRSRPARPRSTASGRRPAYSAGFCATARRTYAGTAHMLTDDHEQGRVADGERSRSRVYGAHSRVGGGPSARPHPVLRVQHRARRPGPAPAAVLPDDIRQGAGSKSSRFISSHGRGALAARGGAVHGGGTARATRPLPRASGLQP